MFSLAGYYCEKFQIGRLQIPCFHLIEQEVLLHIPLQIKKMDCINSIFSIYHYPLY